MTKCVICERRPGRTEHGWCLDCASKVEAERRHKVAEQPTKFLTYRGIVVGLYPNGDGKLKASLLRRKAENLPKTKTLDLNTYLPGYTRQVIKSFKSCCLKLAAI